MRARATPGCAADEPQALAVHARDRRHAAASEPARVRGRGAAPGWLAVVLRGGSPRGHPLHPWLQLPPGVGRQGARPADRAGELPLLPQALRLQLAYRPAVCLPGRQARRVHGGDRAGVHRRAEGSGPGGLPAGAHPDALDGRAHAAQGSAAAAQPAVYASGCRRQVPAGRILALGRARCLRGSQLRVVVVGAPKCEHRRTQRSRGGGGHATGRPQHRHHYDAQP
mmetsp:Transcript_31184/g.78795  ORF Transcript_31184/g.78795 Transcript_31184/m.78795 type:complete len:225 (+) Transcript_31184:1517-2191(+)